MKNRSTSDATVAANRRNAKKSTGPKNTTSTRFNAVKHSLLSAGVTELDDIGSYQATLRRLGETYFDALEVFLVERIALYMTRLRRGSRLEAEFITGVLNPPIHGEGIADLSDFTGPVLDPGLPVSIGSESVKALVDTYQRYETANENKLYRAMNQLERIRRIREGEQLPAPAALDVGVHCEPPRMDSNGAVPNVTLESSQCESAHRCREAYTEGVGASDVGEQRCLERGESTEATEEDRD